MTVPSLEAELDVVCETLLLVDTKVSIEFALTRGLTYFLTPVSELWGFLLIEGPSELDPSFFSKFLPKTKSWSCNHF